MSTLLNKLGFLSVAMFIVALMGSPVFSGELKSAYTKLDFKTCEILERAAEGEGESVSMKCAGHKGIPVYVNADDLRFDIDYGLSNKEWNSIGPFNEPHTTIEWLIEDGRAVATIHRYVLENGDVEPAQTIQILKISKVGRDGVPGCPIGYVNASANKNANVMAREVANSSQTFNCQTDAPLRPGKHLNLDGTATIQQ